MGYRVYDEINEYMGPVCTTIEAAERAERGYRRSLRAGQLARPIIVTRHPTSPGRCVDARDGLTVWPPHGQSAGAVEWLEAAS